mgnify:CR=1 FL=1
MTYRPETLALHAGQSADAGTHSFAAPLYQTVAYTFDDVQDAADLFSLKKPGNIYSRIMNPTQDRFEQRIAALEGGVGALATASGAAAITYAVLNLLASGDNMVALSTLYGGTFALFVHTLPQYGIQTRLVDPSHPERLAELVDDRTRLVFAETLPNPGLNVVDLDAWSQAAHALGLPLIVDNTVPTPYLCRPIEHGADVVVHSATKYLGGHGSVMGGVIVDSGRFDWAGHADRFALMATPDASYHGTVWTDAGGPAAYILRARTVLMRNTGATLAPFNAWLLAQSTETLHLRMARHSANALAVASYLAQHPDVAWVNYPGLPSSPYKAVADRVFTGHGYSGLVSFGLTAGRPAGARFIEHLQLFSHVVNIGDARSMAVHPASTTHSQLTDTELEAAGVAPEMVRLSVGLENAEDLIEDLDQALIAAR